MEDQKNRRRTEFEMQALVEAWLRVRGVESCESFCARQGLSVATFAYWRKRLRPPSQTTSASAEIHSGFTRIERPKGAMSYENLSPDLPLGR